MSSSLIYCVYLTIYRGNKLPPFYIGSTSVDNLNGGYRGSVSSKEFKELWKEEVKHHPELFKTHIVSTHKTRKDALVAEDIIQRKLNVVHNPLYTNKAYASGCFGAVTGKHPRLGVIVKGTETANKIGRANKGKKRTSEVRKQQSISRSGELHWKFGKETPIETTKRISDTLKERNKTFSSVRGFSEFTLTCSDYTIENIIGDCSLLENKKQIKISGLEWNYRYTPGTCLYKRKFQVSLIRTQI